MTVFSKFYPGEVGTVLASSDGWLIVSWSGEPNLRCYMRVYAVTIQGES